MAFNSSKNLIKTKKFDLILIFVISKIKGQCSGIKYKIMFPIIIKFNLCSTINFKMSMSLKTDKI